MVTVYKTNKTGLNPILLYCKEFALCSLLISTITLSGFVQATSDTPAQADCSFDDLNNETNLVPKKMYEIQKKVDTTLLWVPYSHPYDDEDLCYYLKTVLILELSLKKAGYKLAIQANKNTFSKTLLATEEKKLEHLKKKINYSDPHDPNIKIRNEISRNLNIKRDIINTFEKKAVP